MMQNLSGFTRQSLCPALWVPWFSGNRLSGAHSGILAVSILWLHHLNSDPHVTAEQGGTGRVCRDFIPSAWKWHVTSVSNLLARTGHKVLLSCKGAGKQSTWVLWVLNASATKSFPLRMLGSFPLYSSFSIPVEKRNSWPFIWKCNSSLWKLLIPSVLKFYNFVPPACEFSGPMLDTWWTFRSGHWYPVLGYLLHFSHWWFLPPASSLSVFLNLLFFGC